MKDTKKKIPQIIVRSRDVHGAVIAQMDAMQLTPTEIVKEFNSAGIKIHMSSLSRYINHGGSELCSLTELQITYLCALLNIKLAIIIELGDVSKFNSKKRVEKLIAYDKWVREHDGNVMISSKRVSNLTEKALTPRKKLPGKKKSS
jgi:hypothetical protein